MKGDFTRNTFNPLKHFSRVLMQQGRVQLDADFNEQVSILLHYIETLAADIIGPYAGPDKNCGFEITPTTGKDFTIGKGRYYVDGILCENTGPDAISYLKQPDLPNPRKLEAATSYIVYLDVWERHITSIEDDDIREKALGGADTATRAKTVWQVKIKKLVPPYGYTYCHGGAAMLDNELTLSKACIRARAKRDPEESQPCLAAPEAHYRGAENQLYRIEVHDGSLDEQGISSTPTFKWSRENGCVVMPVKSIAVATDSVSVELESMGRDDRFGLVANDWVELVDDASDLNGSASPLFQVKIVDRFAKTVTLIKKSAVDYDLSPGSHALLRRWDQKKNVTTKGVIEITESENPETGWIELENGISIQFHPNGTYRTGDYWLVPARTATGDVEWPAEKDALGKTAPAFRPPHGVLHHLGPLAVIFVESSGTVTRRYDCRCTFKSLTYACAYSYYGQLGIGVDLLCPE